MRILLINHFPLQGSGSGIYTLNIASELIKLNHEVFVIDIDNVLDTNNYSFRRRTIMCDKSINKDADLPFNFPCFTTHPRSLKTYYDLSDHEIEEYIATFQRTTDEICQDFQPDLIHAQHLWITPYVAAKTGIPFVITVHGTDLMGFEKDERYHKFVFEAAEKAKYIITISNQVHQKTIKLVNPNHSKLVLNPNGFDQDIFHIKDIDRERFYNKHSIDPKYKKIISFVGKFTDFKGIDLLIKAAYVVTDRFPDVCFILAGDGQLRSEMEELTASLKLTNVYFLGHQTQDEVADLYNLAELSTVPSRIEPFGLVAIEALACGTSVVASNAGGLPDFINEKVGQLVKMEDHIALAKAIIDELTHNSKKTKGKYAFEYANSKYSWSSTIKNVIRLYEA
ncbi:MAG: glycosyltransferase family 4 protein [Candidatus Cloacimonetes bacterium]|nr:glycosyltransferase family 4 protein [Candidatus Cloacimonadota bacterium]